MDKLLKIAKKHSTWLSTLVIVFLATVFFISIPFQNNLIEEEKVKKVYYVDNISAAHQIIIDRFNKQYKNKIEIVPVNLPFTKFTTNDRKSILTRSLRNKSDGIDIFAVDLIWITRFSKWSHPLEGYIDYSIINKFNDIALEACYINNNLVAFPLFFDVGTLYYRKDIIRSLPDGKQIEEKINQSLTWQEFIELGNRFKDRNKPFYVFPGGNFEGMLCNYHEQLSNKLSYEIFSNDLLKIGDENSKRALQLFVDFIYKYKFTPPEVTEYDDFLAYVNGYKNDAVFIRGWVGFPKHYKDFLGDTTKIENMSIAPLPHFKGNKTSSVFGGWNLMISKFSEKKKEALEYLKFVFKKENQITLYEVGGYLPVNTEVYSDSAFINRNPELKKIEKILKWAKHRPSLKNYTQISEILGKYFHKALKNEISVDETFSSIVQQLKEKKHLK